MLGLVAVGRRDVRRDPRRDHERAGLDHLQLSDAKDQIAGWLQDIGVDPSTATNAKDEASRSVNDAGSALLTGLGEGIRQLSALAFFLAMTALSLFFLLKDGPHDPRVGRAPPGGAR